MGSEVYHNLKNIIKSKYGQDACNVGDEGGFAPNISSNEEGLSLVTAAIEKAGFTGKVKIGMDIAASEFITDDKMYDLNFKIQPNDGSDKKTAAQMLEMYNEFVTKYPVVSIEDPFEQDDWEPATTLTAENTCQVRVVRHPSPPQSLQLLVPSFQVVGDDMLVTNPVRVKRAIEGKVVNALLLKINQIGTISESIEAVGMSKAAGWGVMTSHRWGFALVNHFIIIS